MPPLKRLGLCAFALCFLARPALAFSANDAADCAAFDMANWDYEVTHFSAEDRSTVWKDQSGAFAQVAMRMGLSAAEVKQTIAKKRGPMEKLITDHVLRSDAKTKRAYRRLEMGCARIMRKAPEMAPFR